MTALGIALTVAVLLAILALVEGLRTSLAATGNPLHVLVMRKGSTSELTSNFSRTAFQDLKFKPGIARSKSGEPLASLELVTVVMLESPDKPEGMNISLRGLLPIGFEMRENFRMVEGRMFETASAKSSPVKAFRTATRRHASAASCASAAASGPSSAFSMRGARPPIARCSPI